MLRKNIILLITVLVLPFVVYVHDVDAVGYGCSGSKKEVRECLKAVISERDSTIEELQDAVAKAEAAQQRLQERVETGLQIEKDLGACQENAGELAKSLGAATADAESCQRSYNQLKEKMFESEDELESFCRQFGTSSHRREQ